VKEATTKAAIVAAIYIGEALSVVMLGRSPGPAEDWYVALQVSPLEVALTVTLLCAVAPFLPLRPSSIMDHFLWWSVATILTPAWVLAQWTFFFPEDAAWAGVGYSTAGFLTLLVVAKLLPASDPQLSIRMKPHSAASGAAWAIALGLGAMILMVGLPDWSSLSFSSVYEKRAAFMASLPILGARISDWINFVFMPLAIILGLRYRRLGVAIMGVFGGLAIYAWMATKNSLILIVAAAALYYLFAQRRWAIASFPGFLALLAVVPAVAAYVGSNTLLYFVARRTLIVPSFTMMGHAQLGLGIGSAGDGMEWVYSAVTGLGSYDQLVYGSYAVGEMLRPGEELNANSHFLAFPMMWGSLLPVLLVALLTTVLIWMMDRAAAGADPLIAVPFGTAVAINLSTAYLLDGLIAVGIALAIILLRVLPAPSGMIDRVLGHGHSGLGKSGMSPSGRFLEPPR